MLNGPITKACDLLEFLYKNPTVMLQGHFGSKPSAPWRYSVTVDNVETRVYAKAMRGALDSLHTCDRSWMHCSMRLKVSARRAMAKKIEDGVNHADPA